MPDDLRARDVLLELYRLATLVSSIPPDDSTMEEALTHELEIALRALKRAVRLADRRSASRPPSLAHALTDRERAIAECLASGQSYKEVATTFGLTVASAQSRVRAIYLKLGIHSKNEIKAMFVRVTRGGA